MRYVELRRHTDNDGDELSDAGRAAARELGVHPPYDRLVSTGAHRATQTLEILRSAAGQPELEITESTDLRSDDEDRWREIAQQAGMGASVARMREVDPGFVDAQAESLGAALRRVAETLPDGGRALVVGHSPTNEAAVLGLVGEAVDPLGKGDGVLVVEADGRYRVEPL